MKYLSLTLLSFFVFSCQQPAETASEATVAEPPSDPLEGAWRMTDFLQITNDGDTIDDDRVQYKMYVNGSVMWGFEAPEKYTEYYGYGTYYIEGDTLYETMTSGSWAFRQAISQNGNFFRIGIQVEGDSYTQVIVGSDETTYETYERVN